MLYLIWLFVSHPEINPLWVNKDFLYFSVKVGVSPSNEKLIPEKDQSRSGSVSLTWMNLWSEGLSRDVGVGAFAFTAAGQ